MSVRTLNNIENVITSIDGNSSNNCPVFEALRTFFDGLRNDLEEESDDSPLGFSGAAVLSGIKTHGERALTEISLGRAEEARVSIIALLTALNSALLSAQ